MFRIKKMLLGIVAVSSAILLSTPRAQAGFALGDSVTISGEPVFAVKSGFDGFSPHHRAHLAQDALDNAIVTSPDLSPSCVSVQLMNGSPIVAFNGHRIITADFGSANAEGLSPRQLADRWASAIREKLADGPKMLAYRQTLMLNNPIQSAVVAKKQTVTPIQPAGLLPIRLEQAVISRDLKAGDVVTAVVYENYRSGDLLIPQGSQVFGRVTSVAPGAYEIVFEELRTPDGARTTMSGTLSCSNVSLGYPHPVCTLAIPAGQLTGQHTAARVPATIAIGALPQPSQTVAFVIRSDSEVNLETDQSLAVIIDNLTPIASLQSGTF
jgi:hypothetical protein